jgi:hypothetical protein
VVTALYTPQFGYKNGNGMNNATDDGTSASQIARQYERTHVRIGGQN